MGPQTDGRPVRVDDLNGGTRMMTERGIATLVGNGLSIAFNPELNLQSITEEVLRRIEKADGGDVVVAMKEIAERALPDGATSAEDFEVLVGVFGAESRTLDVLGTLAVLTKPSDKDLRDAIRRVSTFAKQIRDTGVSHVLEVIAERSHAYVTEAQSLYDLITAITESFDGRVVIGNLNYDTLLLAALLAVCQSDVADMGHGNRPVNILVHDGVEREVQRLRSSSEDFPGNKRVQLLHIHGSLTYWATQDKNIYAKLPKEILNGRDQWRAIREETTNVRPVVVLANRKDKAEHVARYPFSLAYEMFSGGLAEVDHWLIIGYSFRDDPVNSALRAKFINRDRKPYVLVVTYGRELQQRDVERAFGWRAEDGSSTSWLTINRGGARGVENTDDWQDFVKRRQPRRDSTR
ncbi:SIR2 family protein [Rathayibacter agropyri]|uniref:SIR2 family protein n=1 Tax=Rathayibacter agropyri TaxID=1634927 RepID=UPI0015664B45|nr:SIR2 family protein [Rathayibacter agropyri]NRD07349.1 SIR2 family protein [Rathayibacter agropyri]